MRQMRLQALESCFWNKHGEFQNGIDDNRPVRGVAGFQRVGRPL